jgi:hypothetical protein
MAMVPGDLYDAPFCHGVTFLPIPRLLCLLVKGTIIEESRKEGLKQKRGSRLRRNPLHPKV